MTESDAWASKHRRGLLAVITSLVLSFTTVRVVMTLTDLSSLGGTVIGGAVGLLMVAWMVPWVVSRTSDPILDLYVSAVGALVDHARKIR